MIKVTLTPDEIHLAAIAGVSRRVDSMKSGISNQRQSDTSDWAIDIEGACAELAVAKEMGIFWFGHVRSFKNADVGSLHVRSTVHHDGHLIVREKDPDDAVFVLVTCDCPTYTIVGGISGAKARALGKEVPHRRGDGVTWWVAQKDLADADRILNWAKDRV